MGVQRIQANRQGVVLMIDGKLLQLTDSDLRTRVTTASARTQSLAIQLGRALPRPIFIHQNRDGSWAVAEGQEPDIWPEDWRDVR